MKRALNLLVNLQVSLAAEVNAKAHGGGVKLIYNEVIVKCSLHSPPRRPLISRAQMGSRNICSPKQMANDRLTSLRGN